MRMVFGSVVRRDDDVAIALLPIPYDDSPLLTGLTADRRQQQHVAVGHHSAELALIRSMLLDDLPVEGLHVAWNLRSLLALG